jgi:hypothetical protein
MRIGRARAGLGSDSNLRALGFRQAQKKLIQSIGLVEHNLSRLSLDAERGAWSRSAGLTAFRNSTKSIPKHSKMTPRSQFQKKSMPM